MSKEIELKAHVNNYTNLLSTLRNDDFIVSEKYSQKVDVYYFNPIINQTFRIRNLIINDVDNNETKKTIYTVKDKIIDQGIEQNTEIEVDLNYNQFSSSLNFFEKLGFKVSHRKIKKGYSFSYTKYKIPLHIELLEVSNLGWFFEIEFIVEDEISKEDSDFLVACLYQTLDNFNIPYSNIEKRYYSQMLID